MTVVIFCLFIKVLLYQYIANQFSILLGDRCSFEQIKVNSDNVYLMCDVSVHFMSDIVECQAACKDCAAFTFLQGACQVYHNERCVNMLNDLGKNHYIKHCHNTGRERERESESEREWEREREREYSLVQTDKYK